MRMLIAVSVALLLAAPAQARHYEDPPRRAVGIPGMPVRTGVGTDITTPKPIPLYCVWAKTC